LGRAGRGPSTFSLMWAAPISGPPNFEHQFKHYICNFTQPLQRLNFHRHRNGHSTGLCCGSVNTTRVDGFMARVHGPSIRAYTKILPSTFKIVVGPSCFSLDSLFVWPAHFSNVSAAHDLGSGALQTARLYNRITFGP